MWPTRRWMECGLGNEAFRSYGDLARLITTLSPPATSKAEFPHLRVTGTDDGVTLMTELPGVRAEDLEVKVLEDTVTLCGSRGGGSQGERSWPADEADESADSEARYHRRERGTGEFSRSVRLPFRIDAASVTASLKHGVLTLALPRAATDQVQKISVQDS